MVYIFFLGCFFALSVLSVVIRVIRLLKIPVSRVAQDADATNSGAVRLVRERCILMEGKIFPIEICHCYTYS